MRLCRSSPAHVAPQVVREELDDPLVFGKAQVGGVGRSSTLDSTRSGLLSGSGSTVNMSRAAPCRTPRAAGVDAAGAGEGHPRELGVAQPGGVDLLACAC